MPKPAKGRNQYIRSNRRWRMRHAIDAGRVQPALATAIFSSVGAMPDEEVVRLDRERVTNPASPESLVWAILDCRRSSML